MNRQHRRYNRNRPHNQVYNSNRLSSTPPVNNIPQDNNVNAGNNDRNHNCPETPPEDKIKWEHADTIAVFALIVGISVAIVTYRLFNQTLIATKAAITADSISQKSLSHQITKDSNDNIVRIRKDTADSISDAQKFRRESSFIEKQKLGIDAQIVSLKEIKKQFEIGNKPYLQYEAHFTYYDDKKILVIIPVIKNFGKYPVVVTDYKIAKAFREIGDEEFKTKASKSTEQNIISIENPMIISSDTVKTPYYEYSKTHYLYMRGEIIYVTLMDKKVIKYSFKLREEIPDAVYYYNRKEEIIK